MAPQRRALPRGPDSVGPGPGRGSRRHSRYRRGALALTSCRCPGCGRAQARRRCSSRGSPGGEAVAQRRARGKTACVCAACAVLTMVREGPACAVLQTRPRGPGAPRYRSGRALPALPSLTGPVLCSLRSARKGRVPQDPRGRWPKAAIFILLSAAAGGGFVVWSRLPAQDGIPEGAVPAGGVPEGAVPEDGVTEVLAHHNDNLRDKFVEIPCSEDYDSHKRFAGNWAGAQGAGPAWLLRTPNLGCRTLLFPANSWSLSPA